MSRSPHIIVVLFCRHTVCPHIDGLLSDPKFIWQVVKISAWQLVKITAWQLVKITAWQLVMITAWRLVKITAWQLVKITAWQLIKITAGILYLERVSIMLGHPTHT